VVALISANLVDQEISELQSLIGLYEQKIEMLKVKASNKTRGAKNGKLLLEAGQFETIIVKADSGA
jgi:hypothetical protein